MGSLFLRFFASLVDQVISVPDELGDPLGEVIYLVADTDDAPTRPTHFVMFAYHTYVWITDQG